MTGDRLTGPQLKLLDFLFHCDHANARQCSSAMYGDRRRAGAVTAVAGRLVDLGLVSWGDSVGSGCQYAITPEGRALLSCLDPAVRRFVEDGVGLIIRSPSAGA